MFAKLFVVALAAVGICSGAPLEPRASVSAVDLENEILDAQLIFQAIGDHAVFVVPGGPKGLAHATVAIYQSVVDNSKPLPKKTGKPFSKAVQLSLCNAETTAILKILDAHSLLRQYATGFNADQRKKIIEIVKKDSKIEDAYAAAFAKYTPLCAESIAHNGRITVETMKNTVEVFKAV